MTNALTRVGIVVLSFICFASCREADDVQVLKLAHGLDRTHPVHVSMEYMAKLVSERSSGKMKIDIYPSGQLGTERECIELVQIGSLAMTKVSSSVMEGFAPAFKVYSLPYLFRDEEHRFMVLDGEIGQRLLTETERFRVRGLVYLDAGSRSFYMKDKPIMTPDDLGGKKIRVQESTTSIRMIQALGGSATPIAWGELYTALQQGVVDGAENNPPSFYLSRHYEVCKYYSLNEHTAVPDVIIISTVVWNSLAKEEQELLQKAAHDAEELQKKIWKEASDDALQKVKEAGVQVSYPDRSVFADKVAPMYEQYKSDPQVYELLQQIKNLK
ncbi:MAG: TRAP transporter substrate-binding protein [Bacteroidetes bacterium]|nr:TRAP transporter substrate-binding protein [Bacteroidota bacterium]MCW5894126.1 TRAP transporter substrate-binding protein [Bacteroidota bacterium]